MNRPDSRITLLFAVSLLGACATHDRPRPPAPPPGAPVATPPVPPAPPVPVTPPALSAPAPVRMGDSIHWFRTAAEYRALTISAYLAATGAVTAAAQGKPKDGWAVVLDADETVLDNSVFQRDLVRGGGPFSEEIWATFVRKRSAVPVSGAQAFLDRVKELGGRIAIVTNRLSNLCEDTRENFRLQSLPFDVILCRENTSDKNPRYQSVASGAAFADGKPREVLAFVGDNIQDFPNLKQSLRDEPESAFADFGRRFFIMPNPMYGSWQQVPAR